jgi:hypothetical protein
MFWVHIPDSNFSPLSHHIHPRYLHLKQTSASVCQFSSVLGLFQLTISIASPLHYCNAAVPIAIRSRPGHHGHKNYAPRLSGIAKSLLEQTINIQSRKTSCSAPLTSHASPTPSNPPVSPFPPPSQPSTPPILHIRLRLSMPQQISRNSNIRTAGRMMQRRIALRIREVDNDPQVRQQGLYLLR